MPVEHIGPQELAEELVGALPALDPAGQRVALTLYRLLASGHPVAIDQIAHQTGQSGEAINSLLASWPGVFFADGAVVGFWGLALSAMPHRLVVDGRDLRAWCAWDTLFLPELIGKPAYVESTCPTTGQTISLRVQPGHGVVDLAPSTAVLSFLRPDGPFDADVVMSFCHFIHFFADEAAAREWTASHDRTFTLAVQDGFEIGRLANRAKFGAMTQELSS